jgi:hypothetical protein
LVFKESTALRVVNQSILVHRFVLDLECGHLAIKDTVVLQWHWSLLGVLHVHFLLLDAAYPSRKLKVVGNRGREHNDRLCPAAL